MEEEFVLVAGRNFERVAYMEVPDMNQMGLFDPDNFGWGTGQHRNMKEIVANS
jgi:hypothetical protein